MTLNEGEVVCDECYGVGGIILGSFNNQDLIYCNKCHGTGKLDWIENIVGKKKSLLFGVKEYLTGEKNVDEHDVLKPGNIICDKCNGRGWMGKTIDLIPINIAGEIIKIPGEVTEIICEKCQGVGQLDWIEVVVGKRKKLFVQDLDLNSMYHNIISLGTLKSSGIEPPFSEYRMRVLKNRK